MDDEDDNSEVETTLKELCGGLTCIDRGTVGGGSQPQHTDSTVSI